MNGTARGTATILNGVTQNITVNATLVDGFKIRFISVYDYKSPGYQYSTTVEAA